MPLVAGAVGAAAKVLLKSAGGPWRLVLLALVFAAGIALGRFVKMLRGIQRMQQQLQGVPAPAPPSQLLRRWLHDWLGPVLPLYRYSLYCVVTHGVNLCNRPPLHSTLLNAWQSPAFLRQPGDDVAQRGTPWEVMRQWVADCPPIVRIRILLRPCVIVGSAAGLKRIFQVHIRLAQMVVCGGT